MESNYKHTIQRQRRNMFWLFSCLVVIAVGITVAVVLSLSNNNNQNDGSVETLPPTEVPSFSPTTFSPTTFSPTTSPTTAMEVAISLLSPYIEDIPNSTIQQEALDWLIEDENDGGFLVKEDGGDKLLDRYVLAILYLSTNGDDEENGWNNDRHWMSSFSVCTWYVDGGFSQICGDDDDDENDEDNKGRVRRILLRKFSPFEISFDKRERSERTCLLFALAYKKNSVPYLCFGYVFCYSF